VTTKGILDIRATKEAESEGEQGVHSPEQRPIAPNCTIQYHPVAFATSAPTVTRLVCTLKMWFVVVQKALGPSSYEGSQVVVWFISQHGGLRDFEILALALHLLRSSPSNASRGKYLGEHMLSRGNRGRGDLQTHFSPSSG
jgi:hypothetical protein